MAFVLRNAATGISNVEQVFNTGTGNIAFDVEPIKQEPFFLMALYVTFVLGTGTADLTLTRNSWRGPAYDNLLLTSPARGTGAMFFTVPEQSTINSWYYGVDPQDATNIDKLSLAWTNPDSGTMQWGIEAHVLPARFVTEIW